MLNERVTHPAAATACLGVRACRAEAENRGVSILMMGYISHELQQPLANLSQHLDSTRDYCAPSKPGWPGARAPVTQANRELFQANLTGAVAQVRRAGWGPCLRPGSCFTRLLSVL